MVWFGKVKQCTRIIMPSLPFFSSGIKVTAIKSQLCYRRPILQVARSDFYNCDIISRLKFQSRNFCDASDIRPMPKICQDVEITLNEDDLEEKFVKGSGPGGQKVNKTNNCVFLRHVPTGIVIKCHQSRFLSRNRAIARQIMVQRLDHLLNKENSLDEKNKEKVRKRQSKYDRVRRLKLEASIKRNNDANDT